MTAGTALTRRSDFTSQGTQIEQARATADVMVAMEAAKRWPRIIDESEPGNVFEQMRVTCRRKRVADTAFWTFPRGRDKNGKPRILTGSSVYLMRTIATLWGNATFGARELNRNEQRRESEMLAWAWDLETNVRVEETFIVAWVLDLEGGGQRDLISNRDIRDNLSNVAQRKVRTQIYNMLPDDYVAEAEETARAVIEGKDKKIEDVRKEVADIIAPLGIPLSNVLHRVGRHPGSDVQADLVAAWRETTRGDLATLRILAGSITREENTARDLFPAPQPSRPVATVTPATGAAGSAEVSPPSPAATTAPDTTADPAAPGTPAPVTAGKSPAPAPAAADEDVPPVTPDNPQVSATPESPPPTPAVPSTQPQHRNVMRIMRAAGFPSVTAALYAVHTLGAPDTAVRGSLEDFSKTEMSRAINILVGWEKEGPDGDTAALAGHVDDLLPGEGDPAWTPIDEARAAHEAARADKGAPMEPPADADDAPQD